MYVTMGIAFPLLTAVSNAIVLFNARPLGGGAGVDAVIIAFVIINPANRVLIPIMVTEVVTAILGLAVSRLLPSIHRASVAAFNPR